MSTVTVKRHTRRRAAGKTARISAALGYGSDVKVEPYVRKRPAGRMVRARPMSYYEEQKLALEQQRRAAIRRLTTGQGEQTIYIYRPGMLDQDQPTVIEGEPIRTGAHVVITKEKIDPLGKFVFVIDAHGNRQSVYRAALEPVWKKGTKP